jgi:hypothetical protein
MEEIEVAISSSYRRLGEKPEALGRYFSAGHAGPGARVERYRIAADFDSVPAQKAPVKVTTVTSLGFASQTSPVGDVEAL